MERRWWGQQGDEVSLAVTRYVENPSGNQEVTLCEIGLYVQYAVRDCIAAGLAGTVGNGGELVEKGRRAFNQGLAVVVSETSMASTIVNSRLTEFVTPTALKAPPHRAPLAWVRLRRGFWYVLQANEVSESIVVGQTSAREHQLG